MTQISHPYPLAARQRAISEYHPASPCHTPTSHPRPRTRAKEDTRTSSPMAGTSTSSRSPSAARRARSVSMASTSPSHLHNHGLRAAHMPMRVQDIPFPLLQSHPGVSASASASASSAPGSMDGSPVRQHRALMETAALLPAHQIGMGGIGGDRGASWRGDKGKLKKVQLVEKDWELWRAEDWGGYGETRKQGVAAGGG